MIQTILTYPHKKLFETSLEVETFDNELHQLLDDMYDTMIHAGGIGLAAIQIGVSKRVLVINLTRSDDEQMKDDLIEVINPEIIVKEGETFYSEGCLSVPDYYEEVMRFEKITVTYYDRYGTMHTKECDGLLAIAFQHEIDHLDGHLFIEKLSILKRKKFDKEMKERSKAQKKRIKK